MLTDTHLEELDKKGYTVVENVIPHEECDDAISKYRKWLCLFKDNDGFPISYNTLINRYNTGNLAVTWEVRLKSKKVFAELWNTDKLLTSVDAIGIGRPPEDGSEDFQEPDNYWLHSDQIATRVGLHAYQGTVYLEEQCADDWTFQVMEGSHTLLESFYETFPEHAKDSEHLGHCDLTEETLQFYKNAKCKLVRVPVPKGGMALWDSRLIHANARPLKGRDHPGRWRFVIFVSMTPAIWASEEDLAKHKETYEKALMTSHWSSQGLVQEISTGPDTIDMPKEVPDVAKTDEAKLLSGVIPYDFDDGKPNGGDYRPEWISLDQVGMKA